MVEVICLWEAPRSRGTSISYALYNGLKALGYKCEFWDEPFHCKHLESVEEQEGDKAKKKYINNIKYPEDKNLDFIIQKHQAKQLLDKRTENALGKDLDWIKNFRNIILFRDPYETIVSHQKELDNRSSSDGNVMSFEQVGVEQLVHVFNFLKNHTDCGAPIVVDSNELLVSPMQGVKTLCDFINIPFSKDMVNWGNTDIQPPAWGKHWYEGIMNSRGLLHYTPKERVPLDPRLDNLVMRTEQVIQRIKEERINFMESHNPPTPTLNI